MSDRRLILASASPRRKALLEEAGYVFEIRPADVDEKIPEGMKPERGAVEVARRKAVAAAAFAADAVVIAADTIVVAPGGEILGKPRDKTDAREMLGRLSGTTHTVITGVVVMDARTGRFVERAVATEVVFGRMSRREIDTYVASGEAMGKAGAYAIQETGDRFVREIRGSFTNVVGLPVEVIGEMLGELRGAARVGECGPKGG